MNKSNKKVENEITNNKKNMTNGRNKEDFNTEIENDNLAVADLIKKDSENIPLISPDVNVLNEIRNKKTANKGKIIIKLCTGFAACLVLAAGIIVWQRINAVNSQRDNTFKTVNVAKNNEFKMASSYNEIYHRMYEIADENNESSISATGSSMKSSDSTVSLDSAKKSSGLKAYSTTNVQTEGVDEGDVVKTDGKYIYMSNDEKGTVNIVKAEENKTKKVSIIKVKYNKKNTNISEIYYAENKLIVISTECEEPALFDVKDKIDMQKCVANSEKSITVISVYDVTDRTNPKLIRQNTQEGDFDSSRLSGKYVYTVSQTYVNLGTEKESSVPKINDKPMDYSKIYLPNEISDCSYTVITAMDISNPNGFYDQTAIAGSIENLYVSNENIYFVTESYEDTDISDTDKGKSILKKKKIKDTKEKSKELSSGKINKLKKIYGKDKYDWSKVTKITKKGIFRNKTNSNIIKYSYKAGKLNFVTESSVEGYADTNLSFDEKDGYLRFVSSNDIYICIGEKTVLKDGKGKNISEEIISISDDDNYYAEDTVDNNVYVLDSNLNEVASIKGLAKDERVYAVRYLGNYGYFITYENTDPLFTVDFSNIKNPKITGKLKLPGYSDYLHFYNENLMLGLGMENDKYLKLEMYNVSKGKAEQKAKKILTDYGDSTALNDYKSILVDNEKNLIGFDATLNNDEYYINYVLYRYAKGKFKKLAEIPLSDDAWDVRGLYIDNYFYVVYSGSHIKVLNQENYKVVKKIKF